VTRISKGASDMNFDIQLAPDGLRQQWRPF
jgi:hypothetical protein